MKEREREYVCVLVCVVGQAVNTCAPSEGPGARGACSLSARAKDLCPPITGDLFVLFCLYITDGRRMCARDMGWKKGERRYMRGEDDESTHTQLHIIKQGYMTSVAVELRFSAASACASKVYGLSGHMYMDAKMFKKQTIA